MKPVETTGSSPVLDKSEASLLHEFPRCQPRTGQNYEKRNCDLSHDTDKDLSDDLGNDLSHDLSHDLNSNESQ